MSHAEPLKNEGAKFDMVRNCILLTSLDRRRDVAKDQMLNQLLEQGRIYLNNHLCPTGPSAAGFAYVRLARRVSLAHASRILETVELRRRAWIMEAC